MRTLFWSFAVAIVAVAYGFYWIAAESSIANSPMAQYTGGLFLSDDDRQQADQDENVSVPEDPQPAELMLPAQPVPVKPGNSENRRQESSIGGEYSSPDPVIPLPIYSSRPEKGGFYAAGVFHYIGPSNPSPNTQYADAPVEMAPSSKKVESPASGPANAIAVFYENNAEKPPTRVGSVIVLGNDVIKVSNCKPAASSEASEEEQEAPPVAQVQQRMQQILRQQGAEDQRPLRPTIDTMEYRPTDGRTGEFERIPF